MTPVKVPRFVRRPEERPQELLDAALEVFSTYGYRATRLEQVAEAAGVTKGAIYYYFETKEELLKQALQNRIGNVVGRIEAQDQDAPASQLERLRTVLRASFAQWCRPETARMHRLMMGELRTEVPELFDAAMRLGPMRLWQIVGDILAEGQRRGEFGAHFEPFASARFLVSGLMHQALLVTDLQDRGLDAMASDRLFAAAMSVLQTGILTSDATGPAGRLAPEKGVAKTAAKRSPPARRALRGDE
ncbi:MAG TPA: TetR/AcrR family transcriptional regulator [Gemmatimonadaceae bacterium]|nr:TetR/AcrR family transcriptional regulator [Gemmatimonadaceae bacterium]